MKISDLLHASRDVYVLTEKPNIEEGCSDRFWSMRLEGLHHDHICRAVAELRKRRSRPISKQVERTTKSVALQDSLARALGAKSYCDWREVEQQKIADFLSEHGMSVPTDLIRWPYSPGLVGALTAQKVADRLFNSGLPLPKRIFTGVSSCLFSPRAYGRLDFDQAAGYTYWTDQQRYAFCEQHEDKILMRAEYMQDGCGLDYLDMTGRMLMLNAVKEFIGCMYNMMGCNLMDPAVGDPVMRSYNMSEEDLVFELQLFRLFRKEIEGSDDGWVEVLPVPGNDNLIFLKGANDTFDWVIRDQRDVAFSSNPLYPFFTKDEVPKAMDRSKLEGHLYFATGIWAERLEHDAETRHYAKGGTAANWPGYAKLIQRELIASQGYRTPRPETGGASNHFILHRLGESCLMVSPLVTIANFFDFCSRSNWGQVRQEKAHKTRDKRIDDLGTINMESSELPVSVTWLDAVAYCRDYERQTELPVRLMTVEEWQQVAPPSMDFSHVSPVRTFMVKSGEMPDDPIYEQLGWGIVGGDGRLGGNSSHRYRPDGSMHFGPNLKWVDNGEGVPFLSAPGFGEWLSDYQHGAAPAACVATGLSVAGGAIERDLCPVRMTMSYKGVKVGFRLCYVAHLDA
ncbi:MULTISPECIES: formylglycine-generating enzyme family protein [unclassified Pseudomonas]|uniref:formylglycine-generating enzyme family protein n=1 Tax=unclassified Pseudomonas TaxID=196821 RepID=UPI001CC12BB3|nr:MULTISPECIES: formylglycine-generating enzyme family protein [unclassified Pseudomonas]